MFNNLRVENLRMLKDRGALGYAVLVPAFYRLGSCNYIVKILNTASHITALIFNFSIINT